MKESTLRFLSDLAENNHKEWWEEHFSRYQEASADFELVVQELINQLSLFDHHLSGLKATECIFSSVRNPELSRFEEPYKTHFGAYIAMGGKHSDFAGYYFQVQPSNSFMGGGMYAPTSPVHRKIRTELDNYPDDFRAIIQHEEFVKHFEALEPRMSEGAPLGYPKDHSEVDLMKYSGYFGVHEFSNEEILSDTFVKDQIQVFKAIFPLNKFLNETFIN